MKIHYLQHVPFEGPAHIPVVSKNRGAELSCTRVFEGQSPPEPRAFDLLFILGGPMGVYDEREYPWLGIEKKFIEKTLASGKKIIGICLGAQLLAHVLGAEVRRNQHPEIGWFPVTKKADANSARIAKVFPDTFPAFHWHNDVFDIPAGAIRLASSKATENQAFVYADTALGLQFHLESTTESISQIYDACGSDLGDGIFVQHKEDALKLNYSNESNHLFEVICNEFSIS